MKKQSITFIAALAVSIFTAQAQVTQDEKDFRKWEEVIASDSFGGRAPLTPLRNQDHQLHRQPVQGNRPETG